MADCDVSLPGIASHWKKGWWISSVRSAQSLQFVTVIEFRNRRKIADLQTNRLVIHIQPDEGISLRFGAKVPGPVMDLGLVNMEFDYARDFGRSHSTGYERLLHDCMIGDATLFQRADMVEAGWRVIQPVLDVWQATPAKRFPNYAAGTWGPAEADELLARDGRAWRKMEEEQPASQSRLGARLPGCVKNDDSDYENQSRN